MRTFQHILTNLNTSEVKTLTASPADWADLEIRTFRSLRYNGVFSSDGVSQRFPNVGGEADDEAGYWFILNAYLNDGNDAQIQYERKILDPYSKTYISDFIGMLDFNPESGWNYTEDWFEIKTVDASKSNKFINRDEIEYNLFSLESTDGVTVPDFSEPYKEGTYERVDLILSGLVENGNGGFFIGDIEFNSCIAQNIHIDAGVFNFKGDITTNELGDRLEFSDERGDRFYNNTNKQDTIIRVINIKAEVDLRYTFTDPILGNNQGQGFYQLRLRSFDDEGTLFETITLDNDQTESVINTTSQVELRFITKTLDADVDMSLNVPEGGYVDLNLFCFGTATNLNVGVSRFYNDLSLDFEEILEGWPANQIRGLMIHEALFRGIQLATSETDTSRIMEAPVLGNLDTEFESYTQIGFLSQNHITNGFLLRQFNDRALNVSIRSLFRSANAITPIGAYYDKVQDKFYIDTIDNFYLNELLSEHLGYAESPIKTYSYKEAYFNQIRSGYKKTQYEEFKGANEVNSETAHETAINIKSKTDLSSEINADTVGITLARSRNVSIALSEDTKYDDLNYMAKLDSNYKTIQGKTDLTGFKGVEQYYNLEKTPRQNLQRQLEVYEAMFFRNPSGKFRFTKSTKDENISYRDPLTGDIVNEFDDIERYYFNERLIDAEIYEFDGLYTYAIRKAIENEPHRIIPFYDRNGNELFGYVFEINGNPYKEKATYKLIKANMNRS